MNILQELYYGNVGEVNRKRNPKFTPNINKELALYNDICKLLNKEQKNSLKNFLTYVAKIMERNWKIHIFKDLKQDF